MPDANTNNEQLVKSWQNYLRQAPFGVSYSGGTPGISDQNLINAIKNLANRAGQVTGTFVINKLLSGNNIVGDPSVIQAIIKEHGVGQPKKPNVEQTVVETNQPVTTDGKVSNFKQWLTKYGLYKGDINNETDNKFVEALRKIERSISKSLETLADVPANSAHNLIWTGSQINPRTSPNDIEKAINLIKSFKESQAKKSEGQVNSIWPSDAWDPEEPVPMSMKFVPTKDDTGIQFESADYVNTQQIGEMQPKIPADMSAQVPEEVLEEEKKSKLDDRIVDLAKFFQKFFQ